MASPDPGPPRLVCLARYDVWQKGLDRLAALARLLPEVDVVVHGEQDGNQPGRTEALVRSAPGSFRLAPPVRGQDKEVAFMSASLYVQLSRWEGMSVSVVEAMARGLPLAVSGYIGRSMGLDDGVQALVLDADDPGGSADRERATLQRPELLRALSEAAGSWVRERCNPADITARQLRLDDEVTARPAAARR